MHRMVYFIGLLIFCQLFCRRALSSRLSAGDSTYLSDGRPSTVGVHAATPSQLSKEGSKYIPYYQYYHNSSSYFPVSERYGSGKKASATSDIYNEDLSDYQNYLIGFYDKKASLLLSPTIRKDSVQNEEFRNIRRFEKNNFELSKPLIPENNTLSYSVLRSTPYGRHLLLVTLFEGFQIDYWEPRCDDIIKFYLPDSLKKPNQPEAPEDACVLEEVKINGRSVSRADILNIYKNSIASNVGTEVNYSRFIRSELRAVNALVKLCMEQESFDSLISLLVVLRDACNSRVFKDALFTIIQARADVGLVLPSQHSIHPEDFFPEHIDSKHGRSKRQTSRKKIISFRTSDRTYDRSNSEYNLWHLREDCMANTMHATWHILLSDANARFVMPRRGEMFYYMHKQMINRYNIDRVAFGMNTVEEYGPSHWGRPGLIGYNSNLNSNLSPGVRTFPARRPNQILRDTSRLRGAINRANEAIDSMRLGNIRLRYENGVDHGISPLADALEPYGGVERLGNIHNSGHVSISRMSEGEDRGVMAGTDTSMRDPVFYRWHKYIDTFFDKYKRNLGPYRDEDLDFTGVQVLEVSIVSNGRQNQLRTFVEVTSLELDRNLRRRRQGGSLISYERINHDDYVINIRLNSEVRGRGIARVFLVPAAYANREVHDVFVELDKFFVEMEPGSVNIRRRSADSPFFSKGPPSLHELQNNLLNGISEEDFNWGNCGWPKELALPKGNPQGMRYRLVLIVTPLLPQDSANVDDWNRLSRTSWGWCGVKAGDGSFPDHRPMGFPFDRPDSTFRRIFNGRRNVGSARVTITHVEGPVP